MSRIRKRTKKFKARFENGGFWDYYLDLERQFEGFLENVPYLDVNVRVCSFRLSNILLSIGGYVDSAFKEMAAYKKFSSNEKCRQICEKVKESRKRIKLGKSPITIKIEDCLSAFETEYELSQKRIIFNRLPETELLIPFHPHNPKTNAPEWWDIYNGLKHDFGNNFEKANLRITRDALAGAFLLNAIHIPGILLLYDYGMLKFPLQPIEGEFAGPFEYAQTMIPRYFLQDMLKRKQNLDCYVKTALFIYDYSQDEEDEYE